jgi:DNA-binding NarL/FixJ family response regulator
MNRRGCSRPGPPGRLWGGPDQGVAREEPGAHALVLSATLNRAEMARAVESGASGVLNKTAHLNEVVEADKRLKAGETLMPLEEVVGLLRFAGSQREQVYEARQVITALTPRDRGLAGLGRGPRQ